MFVFVLGGNKWEKWGALSVFYYKWLDYVAEIYCEFSLKEYDVVDWSKQQITFELKSNNMLFATIQMNDDVGYIKAKYNFNFY